MRLPALRAALRIARRDALRAKGRSALVLAMIALPVLGVAGADVVYRSTDLTTAQQVERQLGRADVLLQSSGSGYEVVQAPLAWDGQIGHWVQPGPEQQSSKDTEPGALAARLLPPGSVLYPLTTADTMAGSKDGLLRSRLTQADLTDQVWHGRINLVGGHAPVTDDQIAVTQAFLDSAGLRLGASTVLGGDHGKSFTITGVVEHPDQLRLVEAVGRPGAFGDLMPTGPDRNYSWLVRLPAGASVDWPAVQQLNKYGFAASSRAVALHPPARNQVPYYAQQSTGSSDRSATVVLVTVVGMALLEVVLLAGPAFAVGARRSRRQLGLIAAGGGDRAQVRAVVLGSGAVLGLAGAVVGVLLGALGVLVARPWLERAGGARFGSFALAPLDLLAVAGLGLATGLLAAVVPAVQAGRQEVLVALTGRGELKPVPRLLTLLGVLMVLGGAALALFGVSNGTMRNTAVLGGSAVAELGMVACTPVLVGLFGRLGKVLPLAPRLALRDSVRHRGRTSPAVAAVMAAVAGAVAVGVYGASNDQEMREHYVATAPAGAVTLLSYPDPAAAPLDRQRAAVERAMPGLGERADVRAVDSPGSCVLGPADCHQATSSASLVAPPAKRCPLMDQQSPSGPGDLALARDPRCLNPVESVRFGPMVSGDPALLHSLFGVDDAAVRQAAADGKVVVFDPSMIDNGKTVLRVSGQSDPANPAWTHHDQLVDAVLVRSGPAVHTSYFSPAAVAELGLLTRDFGSVWRPAAVPSAGAEQRAQGALGKLGVRSWQFSVERGYRAQNSAMELGLTGFAALVALGAAGIATGLAAADSQRDLATLAAVGAEPRIRRSLSGFQCGVIAAMGAVLGTVCGMVPAVALREAKGMAPPSRLLEGQAHVVIAVPWLNLGLTLVALPLLAALLAAVVTRSRTVLARRTA
ncbi:ABC transporter permease [Streptomyces tateyamensis]|uniref:ABC transporter permease n=1 Tax=Streptomyces tateyamensis TaxID=565073 RepID=A0A2V4N0L8_9ACTN|nr:FtsX-like permease family protein [Streptomyces tateyamensis]PYC67074.1 ABC transporter permease [Streptomyces tateyamensis]